jgi:hypothetical protein
MKQIAFIDDLYVIRLIVKIKSIASNRDDVDIFCN